MPPNVRFFAGFTSSLAFRYSVMFIVRLKNFRITPPLFGLSSFLYLSFRDFGCTAGVFFAIIGVALWLGAYYLSGYGAAILSQVALFIARKTWLVIRARQSKRSALIEVNSSHDATAIKENLMKGVEIKRNDLVLVKVLLPCENTSLLRSSRESCWSSPASQWPRCPRIPAAA